MKSLQDQLVEIFPGVKPHDNTWVVCEKCGTSIKRKSLKRHHRKSCAVSRLKAKQKSRGKIKARQRKQKAKFTLNWDNSKIGESSIYSKDSEEEKVDRIKREKSVIQSRKCLAKILAEDETKARIYGADNVGGVGAANSNITFATKRSAHRK